jgi:Na+-driven multidrug efflux pump
MYLRVRCFACPAFLLYNVGTGNFRGRKDTRTPLLAYLANNITYVVLVSSGVCRGMYLRTSLLSSRLLQHTVTGVTCTHHSAHSPQELLFVFGLNWGVMGAALAPAIGQYVGLAVMVGLLVREKALFAGDLGHVPTLQEVTPLLKVRLPVL